jgi:NADP-dependent 3-hydroxy acid dehydrogenase YdfG
VTGASRGIGQATAIRLARDFDAIVLVARIRHRLRESATLVEAKGAKALSIEIDLAGRPAKLVVEQRLSAFGRVDALLNVAGAVPQIDLFEMTVEPWDGGRGAT